MPERELRRLWEEYGCNDGFREDSVSIVVKIFSK